MKAGAAPQDGSRFTVGEERLTLLTTGASRLRALIALIDEARSSLRLLYYIYAADAVGTQVRDALMRASERGVAVRLIVDGFGATAPGDFFDPLRDSEAQVCRFLPRWGRHYLLRNHQKLAVADEEKALIGGFNIEDAYFDDREGWRDLGLMVEGPAAARAARYYDALFEWTHRERPTIRGLRRTLAKFSETDGKVRWLIGGPTRRLSPWAAALRAEMKVAQRLDMIAAYLAPTPRMLRAIERVVRRGGAARVITAARSDNNATIAAARHTYTRLLRRGVKVFEYQAHKLHTKLFVMDRVVHVGSANFDVRSLFLNCELMLRLEDRTFADAMRGYVAGEIACSREITRTSHAQARWWDRLRWAAAYFVVAVLDDNVTRRLNFGPDGR